MTMISVCTPCKKSRVKINSTGPMVSNHSLLTSELQWRDSTSTLFSGRNKSQKLISRFFEDGTFEKCTVNLANQNRFWSAMQMLKLVRKWPMTSYYF